MSHKFFHLLLLGEPLQLEGQVDEGVRGPSTRISVRLATNVCVLKGNNTFKSLSAAQFKHVGIRLIMSLAIKESLIK